MSKDNFPFFESYYESFKNLPPEIVGQIVLAMGANFFSDSDTELSDIPRAIFELIRPVLENSKHISEVRSEAASGHGAPSGNKNASKNKQKQTNDKQKQTTDKQKQTDKDKDKDKEFKTPQTPHVFEDEKLNEVFMEYLSSRQGSNNDIQRVQRKLFDMAKGDKDIMIKILEQSLTQGWKGLFPLKEEKARGPTNRMKNHDERIYDMSDLEAEFANKFMKGG